MLQLTELGNRLREEREAKGLSLDDLQSMTKIQKRYLVGIEEGNYGMMPGKFYVRAFIKQYAEAIGLEPEEIFEQYKSEIPSVHNDELPTQLSRVKTRNTISPSTSKAMDILPKVLVAIFLVGAAVLIWVLYSNYVEKNNTEKTEENQSESINYETNKNSPLTDKEKEEAEDKKRAEENTTPEEEEQVVEEPKQEITMVSSKGRDSVFQLKNTNVFKVKLVSKGSTWVNIKNGKGFSFFQGTLKANESKEVDMTNEVAAEMVIGNSIDTEIFINNQKLEYAIPPTKQVRQDITVQFTKAE
ncbi:helix-turn-helix domain-containing protein [Peribacillus alkalitolerans]|uniref:helix-turn-helix domain-containing protein n=1 Tax=Peribacillus alkalitolerans TaxID=1550385 RepID=UPI00308456C0